MKFNFNMELLKIIFLLVILFTLKTYNFFDKNNSND